jgi:hypothetical protein
MRRSLAILAALLMFGAQAPIIAAEADPGVHARSNTGGVEPGETSDRTPEKHSPTPAAQINTTADGETSDRTPANHGEVQSKPVAVTN